MPESEESMTPKRCDISPRNFLSFIFFCSVPCILWEVVTDVGYKRFF